MKSKVLETFEWMNGACVMIIGGRNIGRVGILQKMEKHPGSFDIVHVKDTAGHEFATRRENLFVIGKGNKPAVRLPPGKGVKLDVVTDRELRLQRMSNPKKNQNDKKRYAGKGTLLPPKVEELRKKTREKKKLLKLLAEQDAKSTAKKPKPKKKAAPKKKTDAAAVPAPAE